MTLEFQILSWDRHKNVAGLNWLKESQPSPLDNWTTNGYTNDKKKPTQICFHSKIPITITYE
jgi:hypothetical protein